MRVLALDPGYERLGIAVLEKKVGGKEQLIFCVMDGGRQKLYGFPHCSSSFLFLVLRGTSPGRRDMIDNYPDLPRKQINGAFRPELSPEPRELFRARPENQSRAQRC